MLEFGNSASPQLCHLTQQALHTLAPFAPHVTIPPTPRNPAAIVRLCTQLHPPTVEHPQVAGFPALLLGEVLAEGVAQTDLCVGK